MTATIHSFETARELRDEDRRLEQAQIAAGWFFDDATKPQREAFKAATTAAERQFGHGSDAHCAAIDLAKRQWDADTAEARALFEKSVEEFLATGELTEATDNAWTELCERQAVAQAMAAE